ncbi:hypothetical protein HSBAA_63450 [Vreelandella sulfidaeris]|uniref:Uncharacterized protein n=1 Tax=Vreelandella sulfidaeris TaxID=115553 RepID=A0A455ULA6_9GAMM|nr:hypothetical protein HSBAA_63450 [Halomonas sulfidaeris]
MEDSAVFAEIVAPLVKQLAHFYEPNQTSHPRIKTSVALEDDDVEEDVSEQADLTQPGLTEELAERDDQNNTMPCSHVLGMKLNPLATGCSARILKPLSNSISLTNGALSSLPTVYKDVFSG